MASKADRIVIYTNVFISFLISNSFSKFDKHVQKKEVVFLLSEELLSEFMEVVSRPKLKKYFSEKNVDKLLDSLQNDAELIEVNSKVRV